MLSCGTKCYHERQNVIIWILCYHVEHLLFSGSLRYHVRPNIVGAYVIMWDQMLSCGTKCYYVGTNASLCHHVGPHVIMWKQMFPLLLSL
jgi:hypothetical protein